MKRVLFLCTHNSARSQMAEALLRQLDGADFQAYSAGTSPGRLHPLAVRAMAEKGIDVSAQAAKDVRGFDGERALTAMKASVRLAGPALACASASATIASKRGVLNCSWSIICGGPSGKTRGRSSNAPTPRARIGRAECSLSPYIKSFLFIPHAPLSHRWRDDPAGGFYTQYFFPAPGPCLSPSEQLFHFIFE